jgi:hypothetical protein
MEKYTPGNLVGHGKILQEVRRPIALRHGKIRLKHAEVAEVSPMSRKCRPSRARRANIAFIALVSRCMRGIVDSTYNAIYAFVRLLRIESLHWDRFFPQLLPLCSRQPSTQNLLSSHSHTPRSYHLIII